MSKESKIKQRLFSTKVTILLKKKRNKTKQNNEAYNPTEARLYASLVNRVSLWVRDKDGRALHRLFGLSFGR